MIKALYPATRTYNPYGNYFSPDTSNRPFISTSRISVEGDYLMSKVDSADKKVRYLSLFERPCYTPKCRHRRLGKRARTQLEIGQGKSLYSMRCPY